MFSCAGMTTSAPARSISVARVERDSWGGRRVTTQTSSPPRGRRPDPARPRSRSAIIAVGRTRGRSDAVGRTRGRTRPRPRARSVRHSCTREQCLLSSLPPSSAASPPSRRPRSKYVQCFFLVDRRWSSSLATRLATDDANGRARAREIRSARAVVVRWTTRDDAIAARAR